jgi:hypothetical protein
MGKRLGGFLLAGALALPAVAQRAPFDPSEANFSAEGLRRGVQASEEQCAAVPGAVWARPASGPGECIRYWAAGFPPQGEPARRALVYIPGDQLVMDTPDSGYAGRSPKQLQALAEGMQAQLGMPFILLSRPGIFGSSGDHRERRREPEARLMSAALDALKARHGIAEWSLVGLSGGGHTVAALLGWRSDILCAVPTSANSSPRLRWQGLGRDRDLTGHADSLEPIEQLRREVFHPKLRVFVLGDPKDGSVLWSTQTPLAARLKELGAEVELVQGEGSDLRRHQLGASGRLLGAMCLRERSTREILERAAQGLKG